MTEPADHDPADDAAAAARQLAAFVELWHRACTDFVALVREITPEQWDQPTDLAGWSVKDNVAHTAHLEAVLAGAPEETLQVDPAPHLSSFINYYTEQGVLARRERDMDELVEEIEQSVATRYAALRADPPTDPRAAPPKTPGDVGWSNLTLLTNRPLDVWMHEQDIRRAVDRPGGYDGPVAAHVIGVLAGSLPMLVGKRLAAPAGTSVRLAVGERDWTARVGQDGRAALVEGLEQPTTTVALSEQDFIVLAGGRRGADAVSPAITGDEELGRRLLGVMAVTP